MSFSKRPNFLESDEAKRVKSVLAQMEKDTAYNTQPTYSANSERYPNNLIPFTDKHMHYLLTHPTVVCESYLANLRIITKIR